MVSPGGIGGTGGQPSQLLGAGGGLGVIATRSLMQPDASAVAETSVTVEPRSIAADRSSPLQRDVAPAAARGDIALVDRLPANPAGIQEVGMNAEAQPRPPIDEVKMLQLQLEAFEQVIRKLQTDLARKDAQEQDRDKLIDSLRQEIAELRERLQATGTTPSRDTAVPYSVAPASVSPASVEPSTASPALNP